MRTFSFFQAMGLSFFSKDLYRDVGRHWTGTGMLYLLFLMAIAWLPPMLKMHFDVGRKMQQMAPQMAKDVPHITIKKGILETDPPGRHELKDPDTGKTIAIIDASIDSINLDELPEDVIVVTRTKLVMKQKDRRQTRIQDLAGIDRFSMDRNDAERWLRAAGKWMATALYPFALLFSFIYRICQLLIYAAIGLAFARGLVPYPILMRLTAVAVTPAVLVDSLHDVVGAPVPMWWLICFLIAMFYLHFAVQAMNEPAPAATVQPS